MGSRYDSNLSWIRQADMPVKQTVSFMRVSIIAMMTILACSARLDAHLGGSAMSLRRLVQEADLVVIARVEATDKVYENPDEQLKQGYIEIQVLDELKGESVHRRIDFFGHGHGVARYEPGDVALFFLWEMVGSDQWRTSPLMDRFIYFSKQEVQHKFVLDGLRQKVWADACRRYTKIMDLESAEVRGRTMRDLTIELVGSGDAQLAMLAMYDLLAVPNVYEAFSKEEIGRIVGLVESKQVELRMRIVLVHKLSSDPSFNGVDRLMKLYEEAEASVDRVAAVRAMARSGDGRLVELLGSLLADPDKTVRRSAIDGLGMIGGPVAVGLLEKELSLPVPSLHAALCRSLAQIGTTEAIAALGTNSKEHPNKTVRRYADAQLRRINRAAGLKAATSQPIGETVVP
jgi:HEAT repeat protein